MKKEWILILLTSVFFVSAGLTGCKKDEKPTITITETAPAKQEAAKPAEKPAEPAAEKPKDHPAH